MAPDAQSKDRRVKWYLHPIAIFIIILAAGPLALPLVWMSPAFKRWHKVVLTVVIALFTVWVIKASADLYHLLLKELQNLKAVLQ